MPVRGLEPLPHDPSRDIHELYSIYHPTYCIRADAASAAAPDGPLLPPLPPLPLELVEIMMSCCTPYTATLSPELHVEAGTGTSLPEEDLSHREALIAELRSRIYLQLSTIFTYDELVDECRTSHKLHNTDDDHNRERCVECVRMSLEEW